MLRMDVRMCLCVLVVLIVCTFPVVPCMQVQHALPLPLCLTDLGQLRLDDPQFGHHQMFVCDVCQLCLCERWCTAVPPHVAAVRVETD